MALQVCPVLLTSMSHSDMLLVLLAYCRVYPCLLDDMTCVTLSA